MSARKAASSKRTTTKKSKPTKSTKSTKAASTRSAAAKKTRTKAPSTRKAASKKTDATSKINLDSGKFYYFFAKDKADGNTNMKDLLGGKGANLAEMCNAGVPVPPGFTITTEVCRLYYDNSLEVPKKIDKDLETYVQ
ncbi:MAG TPA: PEP/pyruvate-binding domain-containing protein, partial [candidate division Zixibacteria bacterium]|nr:PEP/pyruvate-binding domain-containing protein [candidate division Zixibacteria bacterium]